MTTSINTNATDYLVTRQAEITAECTRILATAESEDHRELTASEGATIDALYAQFTTIKEQMDRYGVVNSMTTAYPGVGRRTDPDLMTGSSIVKPWGHGGTFRPESHYRRLFPTGNADLSGFKDGHDWFRAVFGAMTGHFDPRLTNSGSNSDTGASGGFYMPDPVAAGLIDDIIAASTFFGHTKVVPVTSKQSTWPRFTQADRSVGLVGGFRGVWVGEGASNTDQTANVVAMNVVTDKLAIFTKATNELVSDASLFVQEFQPALARAAAYSLDKAVATGNGVGMPLGLLDDSACMTVPKEAGQAADTFNFINASKMFAAMYPGGHNKAVWAVHPSVVSVLLQMPFVGKNVAATETVGGNSAAGVNSDDSITLLGRPVVVSEHLANVGDLGDIILVDLSQYAVFMRREVYLETSNAVYWSTDELAYRLITRLTGLGLWEGVGQRPNSGGSESWVVKLEAR